MCNLLGRYMANENTLTSLSSRVTITILLNVTRFSKTGRIMSHYKFNTTRPISILVLGKWKHFGRDLIGRSIVEINRSKLKGIPSP